MTLKEIPSDDNDLAKLNPVNNIYIINKKDSKSITNKKLSSSSIVFIIK